MGRTRNVIRNISWGMVSQIIKILVPFITRTIIIYEFGNLYLGLNGLFSSIIQVLNVSELGISAAIIYNMYEPIAKKDDDKICALLNLYKKCYYILGIIIGVIGLILMFFLENLISGETPQEINIYLLYIINLINTVTTYFLFSYKNSLLIALQRNDIVSKVGCIQSILQALIQIVALIVYKNYYFFTAALLFSNVFNNIVVQIISVHKYPQYFCKGKISKDNSKRIRENVSGMLCNKIGNVVLNSSDSIIISAFLGLKILGIYQNYYYIVSTIFLFFVVIGAPLTSSVGDSIASESKEYNFKIFKKLSLLYTWFAMWCAACFWELCQVFMEIWVGKSNLLSDGIVMILSVYIFVLKTGDIFAIYQAACGIWWQTRWFPIFSAIVNLTINIVSIQYIGLYGVILSTIISATLFSMTGFLYTIFKEYFGEREWLKSYLKKILYFFISGLIAIIINHMICIMVNLENKLLLLIIRFIICLFLPNFIMFLLCGKTDEMKILKDNKIMYYFGRSN